MNSEKLISKKLNKFALKNNWLISGEYIYGEEHDFLFTGMDSIKHKSFITPVPGITQDQINDLFAILEKNKQTMKLDEYEIVDDFLCVRIRNSFSLKTEDLDFFLALLTGAMQEVNIVAVNRCQECGKLDAESTNFVYDLYCYMHEDCIAMHNQETSEDEPESKISTDTISGEIDSDAVQNADDITDQVPQSKKIIFTLFGAILGAIPWLILPFIIDIVSAYTTKMNTPIMVFNFIQSLLTCLCAYLISSFAITGYRLAKAPLNRRGRWTVGIVGISVVILTQFAYLAILIIKEPNVSLTISNYLTNLSKFHFYITLLLGSFIGIIFVLISVLPFFDKNHKSKSNKVNIDTELPNETVPEDSESETEDT